MLQIIVSFLGSSLECDRCVALWSLHCSNFRRWNSDSPRLSSGQMAQLDSPVDTPADGHTGGQRKGRTAMRMQRVSPARSGGGGGRGGGGGGDAGQWTRLPWLHLHRKNATHQRRSWASWSLSLPACVARCCLLATVGCTPPSTAWLIFITHASLLVFPVSCAVQVLCNSETRAKLIMPVPLLHTLESDYFDTTPSVKMIHGLLSTYWEMTSTSIYLSICTNTTLITSKIYMTAVANKSTKKTVRCSGASAALNRSLNNLKVRKAITK